MLTWAIHHSIAFSLHVSCHSAIELCSLNASKSKLSAMLLSIALPLAAKSLSATGLLLWPADTVPRALCMPAWEDTMTQYVDGQEHRSSGHLIAILDTSCSFGMSCSSSHHTFWSLTA